MKKPILKRSNVKIAGQCLSKKSKQRAIIEQGKQAELTLYQKLIDKVESGASLNTIELRRLQELKNKFEKKQRIDDAAKRNPFIFPSKHIAKFFGKTTRQLQNWHKSMDCPRVRRGHWDLRKVMDWWLDNLYESSFDKSDNEMKSRKREREFIRLETEKLKFKLLRKDLVEKNEIASAWASRIADVRAGLLALPDRLAIAVEGHSYHEIRGVIRKEVVMILDTYCRNGRFCEPPEQERKEDETRKKIT